MTSTSEDRQLREREHWMRANVTFFVMYSEYVCVALVIHHAKYIGNTILSSVDGLSLPYLFAYVTKDTILGGNVSGHKMSVLTFCTNFV